VFIQLTETETKIEKITEK